MPTDDSSKPKRPVVGSRTPGARPRKIAGRQRREDTADVEPSPLVEEVAQQPSRLVLRRSRSDRLEVNQGAPRLEKAEKTPKPQKPQKPQKAQKAQKAQKRGLLDRGGIAAVLGVVLGLLALLAAAEAVYIWAPDRLGQDDSKVSAGTPVVVSQLEERAAVEAASDHASTILSTSYKDYDEQVAEASELMTGTFRKEYLDTAEPLADDYRKNKMELEVSVVGASVVTAADNKVEALLFLNQLITKGAGPDKGSKYTPYRALVTIVRADGRWLVENIKTK